MENEYKFWVPEFSLRNSSLACLASEAAIDIDNYIRKRNPECESVKYLSQLLDEITKGNNPRVKLPDNSVILGYAISGREKFKEYWQGKHLDDVMIQTKLVAKDLRDFESLPKIRQEELSDFCVRLSKETADHYNQYYSGASRLAA
ncbi:hypothetical protein HYS72_00040 [Candidatus Pacearchaeota archaeon]|nr:hypothetical protein [Candidatus Pacearchaeota archaeon]MBI2056771.1 hypothetical protein [Candidatus Pacearchaeota archaeon]